MPLSKHMYIYITHSYILRSKSSVDCARGICKHIHICLYARINTKKKYCLMVYACAFARTFTVPREDRKRSMYESNAKIRTHAAIEPQQKKSRKVVLRGVREKPVVCVLATCHRSENVNFVIRTHGVCVCAALFCLDFLICHRGEFGGCARAINAHAQCKSRI